MSREKEALEKIRSIVDRSMDLMEEDDWRWIVGKLVEVTDEIDQVAYEGLGLHEKYFVRGYDTRPLFKKGSGIIDTTTDTRLSNTFAEYALARPQMWMEEMIRPLPEDATDYEKVYWAYVLFTGGCLDCKCGEC